MTKKRRPGYDRKGRRLGFQPVVVRFVQFPDPIGYDRAKRVGTLLQKKHLTRARDQSMGFIIDCHKNDKGRVACKVLDRPYPLLALGAEITDGTDPTYDWVNLHLHGRNFYLIPSSETVSSSPYPFDVFNVQKAVRFVPSAQYSAVDVATGERVVTGEFPVVAKKQQVVPTGNGGYCGLRMSYLTPINQNPDGSFPATEEYVIPFFEVSTIGFAEAMPINLPSTDPESERPTCFLINYDATKANPSPWPGWRLCSPFVDDGTVESFNAPAGFVGFNGSVSGLWCEREKVTGGEVTTVVFTVKLMRPRYSPVLGATFENDINGEPAFAMVTLSIEDVPSDADPQPLGTLIPYANRVVGVDVTYHPVVTWESIIGGLPNYAALNPRVQVGETTLFVSGAGFQDFLLDAFEFLNIAVVYSTVAVIDGVRVGALLLSTRTSPLSAANDPGDTSTDHVWDGMALVTFVGDTYTVQASDYSSTPFGSLTGDTIKDYNGPLYVAGSVVVNNRLQVLVTSYHTTTDPQAPIGSQLLGYTFSHEVWVGTASGFTSQPVNLPGVVPHSMGPIDTLNLTSATNIAQRLLAATYVRQFDDVTAQYTRSIQAGWNDFVGVATNPKFLINLGDGEVVFVVRDSGFAFGQPKNTTTNVLLYRLIDNVGSFTVEQVGVIKEGVQAIDREGALTLLRPRTKDVEGNVVREAVLIYSMSNAWSPAEREKATLVSIDSGVTWSEISPQGAKDGLLVLDTVYNNVTNL